MSLRTPLLLSLVSFAAGYSLSARSSVIRRVRGGVASISASAASPPADAVSMKVRKLLTARVNLPQHFPEIPK